MASDSQTATATTSDKPMENKVNEEAKLMEKEIVLQETADVVKDKPVSDLNLTVTKEEQIDQTSAGEPEKESPAVLEEVAAVVKAEESTVAEQEELKEPTLVAEVHTEAVDEEKADERKDENGEKNLAEQVELKEPTIVKVNTEAVDEEKSEEKQIVETVVEEENKDKEETKVVDVSESTDEDGVKHVEPVDVQLVREVPSETVEDKIKDVEVLEVEPKQEVSEKVETPAEKAKESAPEVEVVKAEETPETTEQAKVELEGKLEEKAIEIEDSGINLKNEKNSGSGSALSAEEIVPKSQDSDTTPKKESEGDASSPVDVTEKAITEEKHVVVEPPKDEKTPEKVVPTNQDSDTNIEKETEEDVSSPADVIEKAITEEKHVLEEPSKDEQENVSEAKDVVTKLATEDENITKDTETPAAKAKSEETLKEIEANKQEESITEKVSEVVETTPVVEEPKQEPEVTTKEVTVKQKQSNSIMSKVKQSLVKAKKAIIGKSPSSKTITTEEAKEETKVK